MDISLLVGVLAELISVVVAWGILALAWNARHYLEQSFFLVLGAGLAAAGVLDLLHALSHPSMSIFPGDTANMATQLRIAGRYLYAATIFAAPTFLTRKLSFTQTMVSLFAAASVMIAAIFVGWFPTAFRAENSTPFLIGSTFGVVAIAALSMVRLFEKRAHLEPSVYRLILGSIALKIASLVLFALFPEPFHQLALVALGFRLASYFLLYRAILVMGLTRPLETLYHDLLRSERVFRRIADANLIGVGIGDGKGEVTYVNSEMLRMMGRTREEFEAGTIDWIASVAPEYREEVERANEELTRTGELGRYERAFIHEDGTRVPYIGAAARVAPDDDLHVSVALDTSSIKESEQRMELARRAAGLGVFDIDLPRRMIRVDGMICRLWGLSNRQSTTLQTLFDAVHPDDQKQVRATFFRTMDANGDRRFELVCRVIDRRDGHVRWLSAIGQSFFSGGRAIQISGVVRDITAAQEAQEEFDRQKELLEQLFENIPVLLVVWDQRLERFRLNSYADTVLGWDEEDANNRLMEKVYPDPEYREVVAAYMKSLEPGFRELLSTSKDGEAIPIDWANVRLSDESMIGIGVDLRESKKATEDLRRSEERFRALFANMTEGFALVERIGVPEGLRGEGSFQFIEANPAFARLADCSLEDIAGKAIREVLPNGEHDWSRVLNRVADSGESFRFEYDFPRSETWFQVDAYQSAPEQVAITFSDITDRKTVEVHREQMNEVLEQRVIERTAEVRRQANQLRALAMQLSRVEQRERKRLARVLHDHIQQMIVGARMQLGWMAEANDPEQLRRASQSVDRILNNALDASRSLAVDLSPPVLHERGLLSGLRWFAGRFEQMHQIAVSLNADKAAEPESEEVRYLLFECVRELLLNVAKHAGVREVDVDIECYDENLVQVQIRDQGAGFDSDMLQSRDSEEISFGLFSIQERLRQIGGHMAIDTAPGHGTLVTLTAPLSVQPGPESGASTSEAKPRKRNGSPEPIERCRVLLVDDHSIIREGLSMMLELQDGIDVVGQAANAAEAIELAGSVHPDVVIMDVNLGEVSGIEATREIVGDHPEIKVIGLSMHIEDEIAEAMREAGAAAYLTKGGPTKVLVNTIRSIVS